MVVHNKLVRDNIPKIIKDDGKSPKTRILELEEYLKCLTDKLIEEAHEVKDYPSKEELADVMEVVLSIASHLKIDVEEIEHERQRKKQKNGGFSKRIYLESVE